MGQVEFIGEERPKYVSANYAVQNAPSSGGWLIRFLIKTGLAKGERGAERILIIIFCICLALTFFVLFRGSGGTHSSSPAIPLGQPITHKK